MAEQTDGRRLGRVLDEIFAGRSRVTRDEINRRAVAMDLPADLLALIDTLPEGEYAQDEVAEALGAEETP